MGSRSKGGYKLPDNNLGHEWHGLPPKKLILVGKLHRRYRVRKGEQTRQNGKR